VVLVTVAGVISYGTVLNQSMNTLQQQNSSLSYRIDGWVDGKMTLVEQVAMIMGNPGVSSDVAHTHLASTLRAHDSLTEVYAGFADGTGLFGGGFIPPDWWIAYERPWYVLAAQNPGRPMLTAPFVDAGTGNLALAAVRTINDLNADAGVASIDIPLTTVADFIDEANIGTHAFSFLLNADGYILMHRDPDFGPDSEGVFRSIRAASGGRFADMFDAVLRDGYHIGGGFVHIGSQLETSGWYVVTQVPLSYAIGQVFFNVGSIAVALIAASIVFTLYVSRRLKYHLTRMARAFGGLGKTGSLEFEADVMASAMNCSTWRNEIGDSARGFGGIVQHLSTVEQNLSHMADGDFSIEITPLSEKDHISISMLKMRDNLNAMFGEIQTTTAQVATGSKQIADGAQVLAQGSTEQAAAVKELFDAMSGIDKMVNEDKISTGRAISNADIIMKNVEVSGEQMTGMIAAVREIEQASQSISKVIKVIDDIAFQTNILALNAAVEAARAGQHGKGFAVVAEEVRSLAAKSAEAAKDTNELISNTIEKAELGAKIAGETAASLEAITSNLGENKQIIHEIGSSVDGQLAVFKGINAGIEQVSHVVSQNSATAQESAAASQEMSGQSIMLEQLISQFKLKDSDGLGNRISAPPAIGLPAHEKGAPNDTHRK